MRAEPVTDALSTVRASLERLREARRPTAETAPWEIADTVVGQLSTVAETVADTGRLPRLEHTPDSTADSGVVAVLDRRYDGESTAITNTEPAATAVAVDRLRTDDGVTVPLSVPANWYVLLAWTADRLRELSQELELLSRRLSAVGSAPLSETYADLSRAATELARITEWLPTVALWYAPPAELADAEYHEVESFVRHTLEATKQT